MSDYITNSRPFSATTRTENLDRMDQETLDLLVVGGGITGVAVARDAAMRGFRTALVEQDDFGSGTSSRSSRLIHGSFARCPSSIPSTGGRNRPRGRCAWASPFATPWGSCERCSATAG